MTATATPEPTPPPSEYTDEDRGIFIFWDGKNHIGVDPLQVQKDLMASPDGTNFIHDCRLAELHTPEAAAALTRVVESVRRAFGVAPFRSVNGERVGGLTPRECVALLGQFAAFVEDLRQSFFETPTPPPPTAAGSADSPTAPTAGTS